MARNCDSLQGRVCAALLAAFVAASVSNAAWAQASASTTPAPAAAVPALNSGVLAFHADPNGLLTTNPNGGLLLVSQVQQLTLADPTTFPKILQLIPVANDPQKRAIGEGLALASKTLLLKDEQLAAEWQRSMMSSGDPVVIASATAAFGDVQIGAVGGGALGGDGGGPSASVAANRGLPAPAPRSVRTAAFLYSPQTNAGPSADAVPDAGNRFALTGTSSTTPGGQSDASNPVSP